MNARLARVLTLLLLSCGMSIPASAQSPDLVLTQAERDSILEDYDQVFPIWGKKAIERGFDLPRPFGIGFNAVYITQNIDIANLLLSTGDEPLEPFDVVQFGTNEATAVSGTMRADLWLFPFLNVYGLYGPGQANTEVEVTDPVVFTSSVDQGATTYGVGLTGAMGIKRNWLSVDVNWTWSDLEKLDKPVNIRILSMRYGRAFKVSPRNKAAVWVGTMNQKVELETRGSVTFEEAVPPEFWSDIENLPNTPWYQGLTPVQQEVVDRLVQRIQDNRSTPINYGIDKELSDPWNMLAGGQFFLGKSWEFRAEAGFIGRTSILAGFAYRFGL